jgi:hypothetical protein
LVDVEEVVELDEPLPPVFPPPVLPVPLDVEPLLVSNGTPLELCPAGVN